MKKNILLTIVALTTLSAFAQTPAPAAPSAPGKKTLKERVLDIVEGGTIVKETTVFTMKTAKGSQMKLEFASDGTFVSASGDNPDKDIVESPSLVSLLKAVDKVRDNRKIVSGEWDLRTVNGTMVYIFESAEGAKEDYYYVNAKTGDMIPKP